MTCQVAPSILAADFGKLTEEIGRVEDAGAKILHIDVMDGVFVPPITFGEKMVETVKTHSNLFREVHLMIVRPELHIEAFAKAGADRIIVHVEADPNVHRALSSIRALGVSPAAAINPGTPVEALFPILEVCDSVLVMTVNPGWGGQPFIETSLGKIEAVKHEIESRGLHTVIEVDGGINPETAKRCREAGASLFVVGTHFFQSDDLKAKLQAFSC